MKTIKYTIQLTASNKEHRQLKEQIQMVHDGMNLILDGDLQFYTEPVRVKPKRKNKLYLLGKGEKF